MMIPLFKTHSDSYDIKKVTDVIRRGMYWADGPEIKEFEDKMREYLDVEYAVAFNSGTSALHCLLKAYGIDGQVIVPSFTFISTVNSVMIANAIPVFADIEPDTLGLDYDSVLKNVTDDTKAIILVHYAGTPARDTIKIAKFCEEHGIILIEDNAEALGAKIGDKYTGTFGDSAILSFCSNKVISTGEGGMAITHDEKIYEKLRLLRSHGRSTEDYFNSNGKSDKYTIVGYNLRMPTMCAALGISQLEKVDKLISMRREIAGLYDESIEKNGNIDLPKRFNNTTSVFQMYTIILKDKKSRDDLQEYLLANDIKSKVYFMPVHKQEVYKLVYVDAYGVELPMTEYMSDRVLSIPIYPDITADELAKITYTINKFFAVR